MLIKPTVRAVNKIRKKYKLPKNSSLSVEQWKEACSMKKVIDESNFHFDYRLIKLSDDEAVMEIKGNHLSKNRVDSLSFKGKLAYKKAFKEGANIIAQTERTRLKRYTTMRNAIISFMFYNKRSRDHDNNSENIKRVQDTLVTLKILEDDKKKNLKLGTIDEVIGKEAKIIVILKRI